MMDRQMSRQLDAWITRDPPEAPEPLTCHECGEELPEQPTQKETRTIERWCNGKPTVTEEVYDEATLNIIGEGHRGETYTSAYPALCGSKEPSPVMCGEPEIATSFVEEWEHEPHWTRGDYDGVVVYARFCSQGHRNEEVDLV